MPGTVAVTDIKGSTAEGWGQVADAFRANFQSGAEIGAAVAVYAGGKPVVDIWAGTADKRTGRPWDRDTIAVVMSTTKGATAICANRLVEQGVLDLDAPVAKYWPEFAANGKEKILVRWLLTHQSGLPVPDATLTLEDACAWTPVIKVLERQKPLWEPGKQHAYHALTYGYLVGEVVRRATGKTLGTVFAEQVARPLKLSSWIGLPAEQEPRVAHLEPALPPPPDIDPKMLAMFNAFMGPDSITARAIKMGGALPFELVTSGDGGFNARIARAAEFPAANMVTDARSIARMYAATIGEIDGIRLLKPETLAAATTVQTANSSPYGMPPGMEAFSMQFGLGFIGPSPLQPLLGEGSFGHPGAGGSIGFAHPKSGIGFGYQNNQMGRMGDTRAMSLINAVRDCLG
jgi:CubicO group peptidase (beta-lactamase class C family)